MITRRSTPGFAAVLVLAAAAAAQAGLLDSPPPSFEGGVPGIVVYRMGPVHHDVGHVDTVVKCDSSSDAPIEVAVEIFDGSDARVGTKGVARLAPGASIAFVTAADATSGPRVVLQNLPAVDHGKLRVSATSPRIACTGHNRILGDDGVASESVLELIKRVAR
jgi:hypothetical protein